MEKILILSDGKPGHVNQSRAFAELSGLDYTIVEVQFRNRLCKVLSYLLDKIGFYTSALFSVSGNVENCSRYWKLNYFLQKKHNQCFFICLNRILKIIKMSKKN